MLVFSTVVTLFLVSRWSRTGEVPFLEKVQLVAYVMVLGCVSALPTVDACTIAESASRKVQV